MKTYKSALLAALLLLLSMSCKRQFPIEEPKKPEIPLNKPLVPIKFESVKFNLTLEYKQGTTKLTRVTHSDKTYILISYLPTYHRVELFRNSAVYHYADFFISNGRATKTHAFDSFGKVD